MHIFCNYGPWVDLKEQPRGGILIQERRCKHEGCGKASRRQTMYLGGSYDVKFSTVSQVDPSPTTKSVPAKEIFLAGYDVGLANSWNRNSGLESHKEELWKNYVDSIHAGGKS